MKRSSPRPGYTLVEMIVVVTVLSFVLSAAALSLHLLYRTERQLRDELQATRNLDRLSRRWREDVHAADSANPSDARGIDVVLRSGETVEYRAEAGGVNRTVRRQGAVAHRDTFLLGENRDAAWSESTKDGVRILSLNISRQSSGDSEGPPPLRFEAALLQKSPLPAGEEKP